VIHNNEEIDKYVICSTEKWIVSYKEIKDENNKNKTLIPHVPTGDGTLLAPFELLISPLQIKC